MAGATNPLRVDELSFDMVSKTMSRDPPTIKPTIRYGPGQSARREAGIIPERLGGGSTSGEAPH